MIKNRKSGYVIEIVILFMLITFGFCMVITTYLSTLSLERKYSKQSVYTQTDLNQIGEYYLRYIQASGNQFPIGTETDFSDSKYSWMDDEAKEFFIKCNEKYHLSYNTSYSIKRGGILDFFKSKYVWRKLVVKASDDSIKIIVELKEKRVSDNETEYYVQNWAVGENLIDESAESGGYQQDKLTMLQKLWRFLGLQINTLNSWNPTGDLSDLKTLFDETFGNWRTAIDDSTI